MGCFSIFPCFSTSKHGKLKKSLSPTTSSPSSNQVDEKICESVVILPTEESTNLDSLQNFIRETRDSGGDQLINGSGVTINLDVKTNADVPVEEVEIHSVVVEEEKEKRVMEESGKLGVFVQLENEKEREKEEKAENGILGVLMESIESEKERKKEEDEGLGAHTEIENEKETEKEQKQENGSFRVHVGTENERDREKEAKKEYRNGVQIQAFSDSSVSSYISYPPMHRYHNCLINEDEDQVLIEDDSSESFFSLPIEPRRRSRSNPDELDDKEVNSPLKTGCSTELNTKAIESYPNRGDHTKSIGSLLNPIENLAQWKTLKARTMPTSDHHQEKENVCLEQEEIVIPLSEEPNSKASDQKKKTKGDSVVTTSLSSWLVEPEKTPTVSKGESRCSTGNSYSYSEGATSWKSFEDRPILGALTMEEVRQISARSSPRKSPCRNPDEMPIIGTVGSYWSHTGQATDSSNSCSSPIGMSAKSRRNRENKASSVHSTPFKIRLERAVDKGAA